MTELRLGVDLGGTKTEAVVLRLTPSRGAGARAPEVLSRVRAPTERDLGYAHIVAATRALVLGAAKEAGLSPGALPPVGVGMPGSSTQKDGVAVVKNSNTTCLNGRPFFDDLRASLGAPIAFANDANCFALAEATFGAAAGARVAFGVILGTGVGGGVVFRQGGAPVVWDGAQGIAGEWGHVALEPTLGPPCYCGRRGCVEQYLSGPAIERAYAARAGRDVPLAVLAARSREEDPDAAATLDAAMDTFGRALGIVLGVLDPDVVVLGGGVSNLTRLYTDGVQAVARWTFTDTLRTRIVPHALGDSAGVYGAALLPPSPIA